MFELGFWLSNGYFVFLSDAGVGWGFVLVCWVFICLVFCLFFVCCCCCCFGGYVKVFFFFSSEKQESVWVCTGLFGFVWVGFFGYVK